MGAKVWPPDWGNMPQNPSSLGGDLCVCVGRGGMVARVCKRRDHRSVRNQYSPARCTRPSAGSRSLRAGTSGRAALTPCRSRRNWCLSAPQAAFKDTRAIWIKGTKFVPHRRAKR
jgi:hypothetical protein